MQLRADLNHALSASREEDDIAQLERKVELDTSRRYESKISRIEGRLHELVAHNQALTSELSKWTMTGTDEDGPSYDEQIAALEKQAHGAQGGELGRGATATADGGRRGPVRRNRRAAAAATEDGGNAGGPASMLYFDDDTNDDDDDAGADDNFVGRSGDSFASMAEDGARRNRRHRYGDALKARNGEGDLRARLHQRLNRGTKGGGKQGRPQQQQQQPQQMSARERLQQVKDDLELVASKPVLHPRKGRAMDGMSAIVRPGRLATSRPSPDIEGDCSRSLSMAGFIGSGSRLTSDDATVPHAVAADCRPMWTRERLLFWLMAHPSRCVQAGKRI